MLSFVVTGGAAAFRPGRLLDHLTMLHEAKTGQALFTSAADLRRVSDTRTLDDIRRSSGSLSEGLSVASPTSQKDEGKQRATLFSLMSSFSGQGPVSPLQETSMASLSTLGFSSARGIKKQPSAAIPKE